MELETFFTADTHFGHGSETHNKRGILKHSKRPWKNIKEHDEALIENWNSVVPRRNARVFHLGDFAWNKKDVPRLLNRLNGKIHLILGNHDSAAWTHRKMFNFIDYYHELKMLEDGPKSKRINICMFHYAQVVWNKAHYGAWSLFGHSHGNLQLTGNYPRLDVGVDCHNYKPINFEDLKRIMANKTFIPVDHHK